MSSAASCELSLMRRLKPNNEHVSRAADGANVFGRSSLAQLRAQPTDVTFDDTGLWIKMNSPHLLEQHAACDDATGVAQQVLEQLELLRQQRDLGAGPSHAALNEIELYVGRT